MKLDKNKVKKILRKLLQNFNHYRKLDKNKVKQILRKLLQNFNHYRKLDKNKIKKKNKNVQESNYKNKN